MMNPAISSPIGFERLSAMSNREFGEIAEDRARRASIQDGLPYQPLPLPAPLEELSQIKVWSNRFVSFIRCVECGYLNHHSRTCQFPQDQRTPYRCVR